MRSRRLKLSRHIHYADYISLYTNVHAKCEFTNVRGNRYSTRIASHDFDQSLNYSFYVICMKICIEKLRQQIGRKLVAGERISR